MAAVKPRTKVLWAVAADMCRTGGNGPNDSHDLFEWAILYDPDDQYGLYGAVHGECCKKGFLSLRAYGESHSPWEIARLWNRAMRSLGYCKTDGFMVI